MAQIWFESFRMWFIPYFLWGFLFLIVASITCKVILRVQRSNMNRRTDEAGVPRLVIPVRDWPKGWSVTDIQGFVWLIGFIIIAILVPVFALLGITLPITLPEEVENLIGAVFWTAIATIFWVAGIITIAVSIHDFRIRRRQLKDTLAGSA
jgi:amino acid transporter